jgi:hypothetical protein
MGFDVYGREISPPFSDLRFAEQVRIIRQDLASLFWRSRANVIGHSYGAYLLLHALSEREPFPGRILLISPVLGAAVINKEGVDGKGGGYGSTPSGVMKLRRLFENNGFPVPQYLEIHTGDKDSGCHPDLAVKFGSLIPGSKVNIAKDQGHELDSAYVRGVLSDFLRCSA